MKIDQAVAVGSAWTHALGMALCIFALGMFCWVGYEYRLRSRELPPLDQRYFRLRDLRRGLCTLALAAIGCLMLYASRINVQAGRTEVRLWTWSWLAIFSLLASVFLLAGFDWVANRRYAMRHRRELLIEQRELLVELARARTQHALETERTRRGPHFHDPSLN